MSNVIGKFHVEIHTANNEYVGGTVEGTSKKVLNVINELEQCLARRQGYKLETQEGFALIGPEMLANSIIVILYD